MRGSHRAARTFIDCYLAAVERGFFSGMGITGSVLLSALGHTISTF